MLVEKPVTCVQKKKKKVNLDQNLYAQINSKWILNCETIRLLEENEEIFMT